MPNKSGRFGFGKEEKAGQEEWTQLFNGVDEGVSIIVTN